MLTRSGLATVAAAALSIVSGRVFGLPELFLVGTALLVAVALAVLVLARPAPVLAVTRTLHPPMVPVGQVARVDVTLQNPTGRRSPRLTAWEAVGPAAVVQLRLAPLAPGDHVTTAYRVPTTVRGPVTIGPLRVDRTDVLGLCATRRWLSDSLEVLVVPSVVPLRFPDPRSRGPVGEAVRARSWARTGTEFHSQREYVPGDDLRTINWKSSARTGELVVTERAPDTVQHCTVVLDPRLADDADPQQFEALASAAASVVTAAARAGVGTRFLAPGIDLRGPNVAPDTMRFLAGAQPGPDPVDPAIAGRGTADGIGLVVVVTLHGPQHGWSGPDDVVVTVDASGSRAGRTTVDASSSSALAASWERVVHGAPGR